MREALKGQLEASSPAQQALEAQQNATPTPTPTPDPRADGRYNRRAAPL